MNKKTTEDLDKLKEIEEKWIKPRMKKINKSLTQKPSGKSGEEREKEKWEELAKAVEEAAEKARNNNSGNYNSDGRPPKIEFKPEYKPSMNWKKVITTLIPPKHIEEETYSRASTKKISTSIGLTQSLGISAIPIGPGKKTIKNPINFCIIWDSSFDNNTLNQIQKELIKIIKNKLDFFILIKVNNTDNEIRLFNIDLKSKQIIPFSINKKKIITFDLNFELEELFKNNFKDITPTSLQNTTNFIKNHKPNVILLSNSNFSENTKKLIAYRIVGRQKFGIVTSNKEEYIKFIKIVGDLKKLTYVTLKGEIY